MSSIDGLLKDSLKPPTELNISFLMALHAPQKLVDFPAES
jgi:hypothetical protein